MAKNIFDEEICDLGLCEATESFEDEVNLTNKKEAKTVDLCALFFLLTARRIYIIKQMKKPKLCILHCDKALWSFENTREKKNTRQRLVLIFCIARVF